MTGKYYSNSLLKVCGWKTLTGGPTKQEKASQRDSNLRRLWSRVNIVLIVFFSLSIAFIDTNNFEQKDATKAGVLFSAYAILYFFIVVVLTPFRSSEKFRMNANRLFWDTLVSSILVIICFSVVYMGLGTSHDDDNIITMIYFSTVTFSTLGFGDISPDKPAQLPAALQAIIGNIHLGMLVGSTFAAIQKSSSQKPSS